MKECNGNYRTDYFEGCKTTKDNKRTYGLCPKCLYLWSSNTNKGREWFEKNKIITKRKIESQNKKDTEKKIRDTLSKNAYWSKYTQPVFNEIARLIDWEQPCIVRGSTGVKMDGGHYISVNSNKTISLNLHNIHQQSNDSNKYEGGCPQYRMGIVKMYGDEYAEFMDSLNSCPLIKLSRDEIEILTGIARSIRNDLKKNKKKITDPVGRILLRNKINLQLGIYPDDYACF